MQQSILLQCCTAYLSLSLATSTSPMDGGPVVASSVSSIGALLDNVLAENYDATTERGDGDPAALIQPQIDWILSNGGVVHSGLEIRHNGVFAKRDISLGETLLHVPESCLLSNEEGSEPYEGLPCGTIRTLLIELHRGNESSFAPYINFLKSQPMGLLPSVWSKEGKNLLANLLGSALPPEDAVGWIDVEWIKGCQGSRDNALEQEVAMLVLSKVWDDSLVPIFELFNHRRGDRWLNAYHNAFDRESEGVMVQALRDIQAGEEIYVDYGERAPELFRDCGIVEQYPQTWAFYAQDVEFSLDTPYNEDGTPARGDLVLSWEKAPNEETVELFVRELERLEELEETSLSGHSGDIPVHEWNMIWDYYTALYVALQRLVEEADQGDCIDSDDEESCTISPRRYNRLNEPFDDAFTHTDTCDQEKELDHSHYQILEKIQSPYQKIEFLEDPANRDMCFSLDSIYQICTKYRPHYHEPVVHYAARFLDKVSRVIFIGGGDSMLLHEVLKYPSLEFVVGLEIDQKVTRNSFKYFGTQPHWDNDKVQWWFGDASKSLLLLPKDYFGTFDLVLVDLSETVMSNTVTKGLNIMSALSLLLKPNGIFLKNEMYFAGLSKVFKHTIQLHYYDVPLVCSQCLVLGSNEVDFINTKLRDHHVETMHAPVVNLDHNFELVHDHKTNPAFERHCKQDNDEDEPAAQEQSPGIALILEAESASVDLEQAEMVEQIVTRTLVKEGLSVVSSKRVDNNGKGSIITVVTRQGYVIVRMFPTHAYCAFDIHLWSSFEKQESIKNALVVAVGSKPEDTSAFRIAAGGMFGVERWKQDEKRRGPTFTQDCSDSSPIGHKEIVIDENVVDVILEESVNLLLPIEMTNAAVICGPKSERCGSIKVLENLSSVNAVIPLWTCADIEGGADFQSDGRERMFSCEKEVSLSLSEQVQEQKIGALIVDSSATFEMAQILRSIVSRNRKRKDFFTKDFLAVAPVLDETESWRNIFVDHLREFFDKEPGFKSDVLFNSTGNTMKITTFSSGDRLFIANLKKVAFKIETRTGLVSEIRHIGGVEYEMQHNFKPTQFFNATDYRQNSAYKQWESQHSLGLQIIFQLEIGKGRLSSELSKETLRTLFEGALTGSEIETTVHDSPGLGEGCIFTAMWQDGNAIILYNGRNHVDVNLFTYEEDFDFSRQFASYFTERSQLSAILRDEMPRGYGRVVNFQKEIEPQHEPHWGFAVEK